MAYHRNLKVGFLKHFWYCMGIRIKLWHRKWIYWHLGVLSEFNIYQRNLWDSSWHDFTNLISYQLTFFFLCRKSMRTAHNAFIGTVALSDLMLCTVTLPINLRAMVSENWPFGDQNSEILCSLSMAAQKFPIFLSSMAIILIGWDRYRCVITPGR